MEHDSDLLERKSERIRNKYAGKWRVSVTAFRALDQKLVRLAVDEPLIDDDMGLAHGLLQFENRYISTALGGLSVRVGVEPCDDGHWYVGLEFSLNILDDDDSCDLKFDEADSMAMLDLLKWN